MLQIFPDQPNVFAFFTQKEDGLLERIRPEIKKEVLGKLKIIKYNQFLKRLQISADWIVSAQLCHGRKIVLADDLINKETCSLERKNSEYPNNQIISLATDGLISKRKGILLTATAADCPLVFFFSRNRETVGICHSGWRGTTKNIAGHLVDKMKEINCSPAEIHCVISPAIGKCHFVVGREVFKILEKQGFSAFSKKHPREKTKRLVDLKGIIREQLLEKGIGAENIETHPACTYCEEEHYFSFRREGGKNKGVMWGGIMGR